MDLSMTSPFSSTSSLTRSYQTITKTFLLCPCPQFHHHRRLEPPRLKCFLGLEPLKEKIKHLIYEEIQNKLNCAVEAQSFHSHLWLDLPSNDKRDLSARCAQLLELFLRMVQSEDQNAWSVESGVKDTVDSNSSSFSKEKTIFVDINFRALSAGFRGCTVMSLFSCF
jgi:hypothetical protein